MDVVVVDFGDIKGLNKKYHVFINQQYCNNLHGSGMCMLEQTRPIDQAVSYVTGLEVVNGLE